MSHALKSRAPRLLGDHGGRAGRWFHASMLALRQRYENGTPFDQVTLHQAAATSALWAQVRESSADLTEAQRARQDGKGRRPNVTAIARLRKRQALAVKSYTEALRRLEELVERRPKPAFDPAAWPATGEGSR